MARERVGDSWPAFRFRSFDSPRSLRSLRSGCSACVGKMGIVSRDCGDFSRRKLLGDFGHQRQGAGRPAACFPGLQLLGDVDRRQTGQRRKLGANATAARAMALRAGRKLVSPPATRSQPGACIGRRGLCGIGRSKGGGQLAASAWRSVGLRFWAIGCMTAFFRLPSANASSCACR